MNQNEIESNISLHGPVAVKIALGFVMLSPMISMVVAVLGAWLFGRKIG